MLGFKPQALNYAAQAEAALRGLAVRANTNDMGIMIWLADQIRDAVHFVMPEDGRIFDDKFKGIRNTNARLPFKTITLEYFSNRDPGISTEGKPLYKATRRVLLAIELTAEELLSLLNKVLLKNIPLPRSYTDGLLEAFPDGAIFVTGVFYINYEAPVWSPCYAGWLLPVKDWDEIGDSSPIAPLNRATDPNKDGLMTGRPMPVFWRDWLKMVDQMGKELTNRYIANDIGVEAFVVLELIEALSCRNVRTETLQYVKPNVNARRIRDGKLPLYETKILTVNISPKNYKEARGSLQGERASPGEHLRCGHVQSYNTREGKMNLWKQSITVMAGSPRAIKKSYRIKKGV